MEAHASVQIEMGLDRSPDIKEGGNCVDSRMGWTRLSVKNARPAVGTKDIGRWNMREREALGQDGRGAGFNRIRGDGRSDEIVKIALRGVFLEGNARDGRRSALRRPDGPPRNRRSFRFEEL
jgi:hypothetical protein